jgi:protein-S-isoprenylcysteine O-methyltransferase Ste14
MDQHKPDVISLVFGGLFVALAVLLPVEGWFPGARWVVPAAVLTLGIGLAVSAIASARSVDEVIED